MNLRIAPLVSVLCIATPAAALTDEEIFREFRFNLVNPGARARGIGGAFVSLADDATAAQANPAGMAFLRRPEYFGEFQFVDNQTETIRATESLDTVGIDTSLTSGTDIEDQAGFSFVSAVMPMGSWTLGFSLQSLLNVNSTTLSSFSAQPQGAPQPGLTLIQGNGSVDLTVRNVNGSFGYRINDYLGIGGTLTYSRLEATAEVTNQVIDTQQIFVNDPLLVPTIDLRTSIDDTADSWAGSLGVIYKRPSWGIGAVVRRAPRFEVTEVIDPLADTDGDGALEGIDLFGTRARLGTSFTDEFNLPDSVGLGGNVLLADDRLTLALNADWIRYSNLVDGYVPGVNVLTGASAEFHVDDGIDGRFGAEYVVFNDKNVLKSTALRGGLWLQADSTIAASSTGSADETLSTPAVFRGDDDVLHLTLGLGFNFTHWNLDTAVDLSDRDNQFLISMLYRK